MMQALELPDSLSRRDFLHLSGMSMLALGLPLRWSRQSLSLEQTALGRVVDPTVDIYRTPSFAGLKRTTYWRDDVLPLAGAALGDPQPAHNRVWYEIEREGFAHSASIQPVRNEPNEPVTSVPYAGLLTEISVPFVDVYWEPRASDDRAYRFYYGSTHWINGVSQDDKGRLWYRIYDDKFSSSYYGRAEAFRLVPVAELTPISSDVPLSEKRIKVDLERQWMHCYEGSTLVFTTKISSGRALADGSYWTPEGEFITFRKRASRHMVAGNLATGYDLPGVPWVCYFTDHGVAFHGTYWHNDFGAPRSHGCVNLASESAKWLYRWTKPIVPADEMEYWGSYGTRVAVSR